MAPRSQIDGVCLQTFYRQRAICSLSFKNLSILVFQEHQHLYSIKVKSLFHQSGKKKLSSLMWTLIRFFSFFSFFFFFFFFFIQSAAQ